MTWRNKTVSALTLFAQQSCKVTLTMNGEQKVVKLKAGENVILH